MARAGAVLLAAGIAFAAPAALSNPPQPLAHSSWVLSDLPQGPGLPATGRRVTLGFDAHGAVGAVSGFAGCNQLVGRYHLNGPDLAFERLGLTRRACGTDRTTLELAVVSRLRDTRSWRFVGRRLEFRNESGAPVLVWRRPYVGGQSTPNK